MSNRAIAAPRRVADILANRPDASGALETTLSNIRNHIEKLNKLQAELHQRLPEPLREHVTVVNCRQGTLLLHARNAAWASKLRFASADLLAACAQDNGDIHTLRIRIMPPAPVSGGGVGAPSRMSAATARQIYRMTTTITDPELRKVLRSIAKNAV